jgi:hypothetical protein
LVYRVGGTRSSVQRNRVRKLLDGRTSLKRQCMPVDLKAKAVPLHATNALGGERRYSAYSFLTLALGISEWSASRHGCALPLGKGLR